MGGAVGGAANALLSKASGGGGATSSVDADADAAGDEEAEDASGAGALLEALRFALDDYAAAVEVRTRAVPNHRSPLYGASMAR